MISPIAPSSVPLVPLTYADLEDAETASVLAYAFPGVEPGRDVISGLLTDIERTAVLLQLALDGGVLDPQADDAGRTLLVIASRAAAARALYERAAGVGRPRSIDQPSTRRTPTGRRKGEGEPGG